MSFTTFSKPLPKLKKSLANPRILAAISYDITAAALAWYFAFALRFNFQIPSSFVNSMLNSMAWVIPMQFFFFVSFGLYKGVWRFASLPDLKRIFIAISWASVLIVAILFMFQPHGIVPRSALLLDPLLLLVFIGGGRFLYRAWKDHKLYGATESRGKPVLLLGAGEAAIALLKDLARSKEWRVVGLLDDDATVHGRRLLTSQVFGSFSQLPQLAKMLEVQHAIVALPANASLARREAVKIANQSGLTVFTVPSFDDVMSGKVSVSAIRRVDVEDLLGREAVQLDSVGMHELIQEKVVMVSGAGGSIGSELCRQIALYQPRLLICLDISELALYKLEQEFANSFAGIQCIYAIGDVKNERRMKSLLIRYRPVAVFHAAAYKHVPLMETSNVMEALSNNVIGTYTLARLCKEIDVEKFVMVSTDKAVNPTNVMGASKRLAEMVCQGLQEETGTRFVIVRFGNVLGSSGSVIPKFREQIAQGGPITVTHPDITRYFMSIPEAAQLVMQAGLMGNSAEIFVLDMGESVRIVDLARDMIRLSGLQEDEIEIQFTGLRPGEKLYEELLADDEHTLPTPHAKLRIAIARTTDQGWVNALLKWIAASADLDEALIKQQLSMWVEEYVGDINAVKVDKPPVLVSRSSTIH